MEKWFWYWIKDFKRWSRLDGAEWYYGYVFTFCTRRAVIIMLWHMQMRLYGEKERNSPCLKKDETLLQQNKIYQTEYVFYKYYASLYL